MGFLIRVLRVWECRRTTQQQVDAQTAWLDAALAPVHATADMRQSAGMSKQAELAALRALRRIWEHPDTRTTLEIVDRHVEDGSLSLRVCSMSHCCCVLLTSICLLMRLALCTGRRCQMYSCQKQDPCVGREPVDTVECCCGCRTEHLKILRSRRMPCAR